jgi:glycosyltransferase involved in cell wall biosynthesis
MTNIAFYCPNKNTKNVDRSDIFNGNPGIGGTEYAMLLLACSLTSNYGDLNTTIYVDEEGIFPSCLKITRVKDWVDLRQKTTEENIHILVLIYGMPNDMFRTFPNYLKFVVWAHLSLHPKDLRWYAKNKSIRRIVCAGYEQLDMYRDHSAFKKSTAIHNGVCTDSVKNLEIEPYNQRPLHVTYIGNIVPQKGFHILARAWPRILSVYPDAVLNVIGSGKLYNRNAQLGQYNIADSAYEEIFMPYLTDSNGQILPSVKFCGLLGTEKKELLQKTRVAIPNPTGKTEICPYSSIDAQLYGSLVATIEHPAYLETICPSGCLLYKKQKNIDKALADAVISLLSKNENRHAKVMDYITSNFSIDKVAEEWYHLFTDIMMDKEVPVFPIKTNTYMNLKRWKEANRKLKNFIPFGYKILPSLWYVDDFVWKMKGLLMRRHLVKYLYRRYILKKSIEQYL